jgi:hypothetical protein
MQRVLDSRVSHGNRYMVRFAEPPTTTFPAGLSTRTITAGASSCGSRKVWCPPSLLIETQHYARRVTSIARPKSFRMRATNRKNTTEGVVCCVIGAQKPQFPVGRNRLTRKGGNIPDFAAHNQMILPPKASVSGSRSIRLWVCCLLSCRRLC